MPHHFCYRALCSLTSVRFIYTLLCKTIVHVDMPTAYSLFIIELGVVSEEAICAELLRSAALLILHNLGLILDALVGLEDEIVFAYLV